MEALDIIFYIWVLIISINGKPVVIFAQKIFESLCLKTLCRIHTALCGRCALCNINEIVKNFNSTLSGGSLGLWVDEERSKLRVDM